MWEQLFAASHSRLQQGLCICARLEFRGPALSSSAAARGVGPRGSPGAGGPTIVCGDVGIWHTARASLWAGALNEEKKKGWSAGCAPGECTPPARAGGGEECLRAVSSAPRTGPDPRGDCVQTFARLHAHRARLLSIALPADARRNGKLTFSAAVRVRILRPSSQGRRS
ncbi:unnamed protein product [Prorocentrum cordatum]|uniref:Uncharacterized protein n=1 Tax=Prorocentrum cordatum TaxID=2364126 RepID=A0ABN9X2T9_9DINO|nr:unnamed protein product [Polarella glacialis]